MKKRMEIVWMPPEALHPYEKNTKKHDKRQIKNVAESIQSFGWQQPIVVDEDYTVIIGHCRLEAAKLINAETVPVTIAEGLTPEEVRELRIVDNKTNESEWDTDILQEEIERLDFSNFDFIWDQVEMKIQDEGFSDMFSLPDGEKNPINTMSVTFHENQKSLVEYALSLVQEKAEEHIEPFNNADKNGNALYEIVIEWLEEKGEGINADIPGED